VVSTLLDGALDGALEGTATDPPGALVAAVDGFADGVAGEQAATSTTNKAAVAIRRVPRPVVLMGSDTGDASPPHADPGAGSRNRRFPGITSTTSSLCLLVSRGRQSTDDTIW
jgi:hypothetical protein